MNKFTKIIAIAMCAATVAAGTAAFTACSGSETEVINISGSTSVQPLMEKLAAAYEEKNENVQINVGAGGSGQGVADAQAGTVDFGMASRALKDSETGVVSKQIAIDGIAMITNTANTTVTNVTATELKALYEEGTPIQETICYALSREDGSGTRDAFCELTGVSSSNLYSGTGFESYNSTSALMEQIKNNTAGNMIGYVSLGSVDSSVKALQYEGVDATAANVKSGAYTMSRPFNIIYQSESTLSSAAKAFIEFIMSEEGQAVVTSYGCVSVL